MLKSIGFDDHKDLIDFVNKYVDKKDLVAIVYGRYFSGFGLFFYTTEKSEKTMQELKLKKKADNKYENKDFISTNFLFSA